MPEHMPEAASKVFAQSRACLAETEGWLSDSEAAAPTHAELEEQLGERGRDLLRLLHQDHLDLRAGGGAAGPAGLDQPAPVSVPRPAAGTAGYDAA